MKLRLQNRTKLFQANGQQPWICSHTALPIPFDLDNGKVRVYFGARDIQSSPSIGYYEFHIDNPVQGEIVGPCMGKGAPGHFDDNGVYPGTIHVENGRYTMWYSGRSNGAAPLFYMAIGLASSHDHGKTFQRRFQIPVLSRTEEAPWGASMPFVRRSRDHWQMWYSSLIGWKENLQGSYYDLRECHSSDGISWSQSKTLMPIQGEYTNLASPSAYKDRIFFSASMGKGDYSLAVSQVNSKNSFELVDVGSDEGWEDNQFAYPHVLELNNKYYVFYSGGRFGANGIGMAEIVEEVS